MNEEWGVFDSIPITDFREYNIPCYDGLPDNGQSRHPEEINYQV